MKQLSFRQKDRNNIKSVIRHQPHCIFTRCRRKRQHLKQQTCRRIRFQKHRYFDYTFNSYNSRQHNQKFVKFFTQQPII